MVCPCDCRVLQVGENNALAFRHHERQKGDGSSSLDGQCQRSLMLGAIARDSSRHDLASFGDKFLEIIKILIINPYIGVSTETTEFPAMEKFFLPSLGFGTSRILHVLSSVFCQMYRVFGVCLGGRCFCRRLFRDYSFFNNLYGLWLRLLVRRRGRHFLFDGL
jgi:hypothetical protein